MSKESKGETCCSAIFPKQFEISERPADGKCFKVEFQTIISNMDLFVEKRVNKKQEDLRKAILEVIFEVCKCNNPGLYREFYLLVPEKEWIFDNETLVDVSILLNFAERIKKHTNCYSVVYTASWIEVFLGWAQQIVNKKGSKEVWEEVSNYPDMLKHSRLFITKMGKCGFVGAFEDFADNTPTSETHGTELVSGTTDDAVPYIVLQPKQG